MLAPAGGIPSAWPCTRLLGWQSTPTGASKHRRTTKQRQPQQQQQQRQSPHSSTVVRHTNHHHSNPQPYYYQTRGGNAETMATSPDHPGALLLLWLLFTLQARYTEANGSREFFSRLTKSTHRSSIICPLQDKSSSYGGKHLSLIPSSLIVPRIFCPERPICPVLYARRNVARP